MKGMMELFGLGPYHPQGMHATMQTYQQQLLGSLLNYQSGAQHLPNKIAKTIKSMREELQEEIDKWLA